MKIPEVLLRYADQLEEKTKKSYPSLAPLAKQCYLNTIETTVKQCDNGDYFVITGDIPALWLRDSAAQLRPYMPLCKESDELCEIMKGVIRRHVFYVNLDPYSNAFNEVAPYMLLDEHTLATSSVVIADDSLAKLTQEQQDALFEAGKATEEFCRQMSVEEAEKAKASLTEKGVTFIEVEDKTPYREACADLIGQFTSGIEDKYEGILALAE